MTDQPTTAGSTVLRTVTLEEPIYKGTDREVATLTLRKPVSGDCRGVSLSRLSQIDVDQVLKLLPRIFDAARLSRPSGAESRPTCPRASNM